MTDKWFTSDNHFGHKGVIRHCRQYLIPPSETEETISQETIDRMNELMINNWNSVVPKNGTVYVVGDFSMHNPKLSAEVLVRLNGQKILVYGNHDDRKIRALPQWAQVKAYKEIQIGEHKIVMSHYAFMVWNQSHRGSINLHGHSHGSIPPTTQRCDVGADCWNLTPVCFDQILERIKNAAPHVDLDYHGTIGR